jgi:hypothetical protein
MYTAAEKRKIKYTIPRRRGPDQARDTREHFAVLRAEQNHLPGIEPRPI